MLENKLTVSDVQVVVIAGGTNRRMGGVFKGGVHFRNKPLIEWVLASLVSQVPKEAIAINANGHCQFLNQYPYQQFTDFTPFIGVGPLAGFRSALLQFPNRWILTVPCDAPNLPKNLVERFIEDANRYNVPMIYAHDGQNAHPLFSLFSPSLLPALTDFLSAGNRRVQNWLIQAGAQLTDFSDAPECFINCNSIADIEALERENHAHQKEVILK